MKKLLISTLILLCTHSFALTYEEFATQNKKIKTFEHVMDIELGQALDSKKLEKLGLILDKKDDKTNISFYKNEKAPKLFFNVKPTDVTFLLKDSKFISTLIEFEGEKNLNTLKDNLTKKLGKPLSFVQNNEHFSYVWGATYTVENNNRKIKKAVRPLVLNFDIYEQMGVVIWSDPKIEFEQTTKK